MRAVLCTLLLLIAAATHAQSRDDLATAARAFDEAALRLGDSNARPAPIRKWTSGIRITFANSSAAPNLVEPTLRGLRTDATEAGIDVAALETGDKSANFTVYFSENGPNGQAGFCTANGRWGKDFVITRGEMTLNPTRMDFDRCAIHEPMHALGFSSHPHAAVSVLSYTYHAQRTLTALDRNLIHTLYDPRLPPGMPAATASPLACRLLGERMGSTAADIQAVCSDRKGPVPDG